MIVTLIPRFTAAKEYIVIDNEQTTAHYAITYHSFTLTGKEYSGHTVQLYKQVAPFTFKPMGEYTDKTNQAGGISSILTNKDYHINGDDLLLGDFKIFLH